MNNQEPPKMLTPLATKQEVETEFFKLDVLKNVYAANGATKYKATALEDVISRSKVHLQFGKIHEAGAIINRYRSEQSRLSQMTSKVPYACRRVG